MHLTGSMCLKVLKCGRWAVCKECAMGRKPYNGQEAIREHNFRYFSSPSYL